MHLHAWSVGKSCIALCNSMDCSPSGFYVHGIFQARILKCLLFPPLRTAACHASLSITNSQGIIKLMSRVGDAIQPSHPLLSPPPFALNRSQHQSHCACAKSLSRVWLFATPWTRSRHAPLSMGLSRQEYWSGLPCPPPGDLRDPEIKPASLTSSSLAGEFFTTTAIWEAQDRLNQK